ncbi:MAG TPA: hypothetical protein EYP14_13180 [Planctomycetaceae bacterium]|nr:hypothetical protein [Planctomycetaceae bacterium]
MVDLAAGRQNVDAVLVVGAETVVGANLSATLADSYRVIALSTTRPVRIAGCETATCRHADRDRIHDWIGRTQPDWIVYSGLPARSCWEDQWQSVDVDQLVTHGRAWIRGAAARGCPFTLISSDAVFTGPWMFHREDCRCLCSSRTAQAIRRLEQSALDHCPRSLVVRTNVFGWAPAATGAGWLETVLARLERDDRLSFDCFRYATPILATDLAGILAQAYAAQLRGVYHVAGTERLSPAQFAQRLAHRFGFGVPRLVTTETLAARPTGFGRGETSLQTCRIRSALGLPMPLLTDGLDRLFEQQHNGHRERLGQSLQHELVA